MPASFAGAMSSMHVNVNVNARSPPIVLVTFLGTTESDIRSSSRLRAGAEAQAVTGKLGDRPATATGAKQRTFEQLQPSRPTFVRRDSAIMLSMSSACT